MVDNKLPASNSEGSELSPAEGTANVTKAVDSEKNPLVGAEYYKELTGREDIKTKEDFNNIWNIFNPILVDD